MQDTHPAETQIPVPKTTAKCLVVRKVTQDNLGKKTAGVDGVKLLTPHQRLALVKNAKKPCHRMAWQFKQTVGCDRHQLRLLSECPNCGARFKIPALWVEGICQRCFTTFAQMAEYQKPIVK